MAQHTNVIAGLIHMRVGIPQLFGDCWNVRALRKDKGRPEERPL